MASNRWTASHVSVTSSPQDLACCPKGDTSPACTASETNHCSPSYSDPIVQDAPYYAWYSYCAGISDQTCGGNQELVARKNETKIFQMEDMLHITSKWKQQQYDACWWRITVPTQMYKDGLLTVKFNRIEEGVHLFMNVGTDIFNMTKPMEMDVNTPVKALKSYEVSVDDSLIIMGLPLENRFDTNFEIEYVVVDAHTLPYITRAKLYLLGKYDQMVVQHENTFYRKFLIFTCISVFAGIIVICFFSKFAACMNFLYNKLLKKKVKTEKEINDEATAKSAVEAAKEGEYKKEQRRKKEMRKRQVELYDIT